MSLMCLYHIMQRAILQESDCKCWPSAQQEKGLEAPCQPLRLVIS